MSEFAGKILVNRHHLASALVVAGLKTTLPSAMEPLDISDRTCLFLDDRFIAEQSGLKHAWHQGQPRSEVTTVELHS
jgi:hypothetical protein